MATPYTWPPQLPQIPQRAIPMTIQTNVARTDFDHGPAYQRKLYSAVPEVFEIFMVLEDDAAHATFWDWYRDVLNQVNRFNWKHPRTGADAEVRILNESMPRSRYITTAGTANRWELSFQLEVPVQ